MFFRRDYTLRKQRPSKIVDVQKCFIQITLKMFSNMKALAKAKKEALVSRARWRIANDESSSDQRKDLWSKATVQWTAKRLQSMNGAQNGHRVNKCEKIWKACTLHPYTIMHFTILYKRELDSCCSYFRIVSGRFACAHHVSDALFFGTWRMPNKKAIFVCFYLFALFTNWRSQVFWLI